MNDDPKFISGRNRSPVSSELGPFVQHIGGREYSAIFSDLGTRNLSLGKRGGDTIQDKHLKEGVCFVPSMYA